MKKISIYLLSVFCFMMTLSCEKDTNDFIYSDPEEIEIEGLESRYTLMSEYDVLKLDISANSSLPQGDFDFTWGVYETNVQGYAPKLDTIGHGPKLEFPIKLAAKTWMLVLIAKNKTTGLTKYVRSTLDVVTKFTRGWYVVKSEGDSSDLDLFLTPTSIHAIGGKESNVYSLVNGKKLYGKAQQLTFFSGYKSTVTGISANTRTLFIQTNKSISPVYINTLKTLHDTDGLFIAGTAPQGDVGAVFYGSSANYVVKGGQLYSIYAMGLNSGLFGSAKMIDEYNTPYRLSDYFVVNSGNDPILFDEKSSSFVSMSMGSGSRMTQLVDVDENKTLKVSNNNLSVLYMGYKKANYISTGYYYTQDGIAIAYDKADPTKKFIVKMNLDKTKLALVPISIESSSLLYEGSMYTLNKEDESLMYFVNSGKLYSRNLDNQNEQLQFTPPADETITFIRHQKYAESANVAYNFNYIVVGTKKAGKYIVRFFKKSSGNLESSPSLTIEGNGEAKDIIYMSPSVAEYTYANSY